MQDGRFDNFILCTILVNAVSMSILWPSMSDELSNAMEWINFVCTLIFMLEMLLKHIGLGYKRYWNDSWNRFDGTIVLLR